MQPLDRSLRNRLERTVKEAREIAERGARAALETVGVGEPTRFPHLGEAQSDLRRRLRAHGRQLGDRQTPRGGQELERLVEEVAYEHWHRMLFARFLAENDLLMYPDPDAPVSVTLEECEDLAADEGARNGWELAARFASRMLPQIFRPDSPVFELDLPPDHQQDLEQLLADLPSEVFRASDALGWVYQFWQSKRKDEVNKSEVKIGARELPAVTQLFTEPYMVQFLLDNALGAWWAARRLGPEDWRSAADEEELRRKASVDGVPLTYLRLVKTPHLESPLPSREGGLGGGSLGNGDGPVSPPHPGPLPPQGGEGEGAEHGYVWAPAAGTFDAWPQSLAELKVLDPCCGSGHFLVAALLMLVPMRMELEGLSAREAVDRVLAENLHGLDIDQRVTEIAAFALALAAWTYPSAGGYRPLPELHIACSGLAVAAAKEEWKRLGLGRKNLALALDWMHDAFRDAPVLGSLLNPARTDAAELVEWSELSAALDQALAASPDDNGHERREAAVVAHGLAKAAGLLAGRYHWVITNVPYLARGKQADPLKAFCQRRYPKAKNDLATVFLERCLEFCVEGGTVSIVLPQNWLFLTTYRKLREKLLQDETWHLIARLGPQAFQTPMWDFNVQLLTLSRGPAGGHGGGLLGAGGADNPIRGLDASEPRTAAEKAALLRTAEVKTVEQVKQLENPDARVALEAQENVKLLSKLASALVGIQTGDDPFFVVRFWEVFWHKEVWSLLQNTPTACVEHTGQSFVLRWYSTGSLLNESKGSRVQGLKAVGKDGVAIHRMDSLFAYHYCKRLFHQNVVAIIPKDRAHLPAIWCFCSSPEYNEAVGQIDQSLKVTNATLVKVPFDLEHWTRVAREKYPHGLPKPYSDDPTQWIFHGHPCGSVIWDEEKKWTAHGPLRTDHTVLQVAVARLLGYRWPAELDPDMELADEQREWVRRCEALLPFADEDGIVCIPPVRGEPAAAERLLNLLAAAYNQSPTLNPPSPGGRGAWGEGEVKEGQVPGGAWSNDILAELLRNADHAGKTLESWLRDKFFAQHCKLFHHRPFIWHIWDGLREGFAALVNYHKLDRKNLETLIYTYLGDWIARQKQDLADGVDGAAERLAAAEGLKKRLELILEGEAPYDIFVRWKPIEQQPIGWDPDLNDGVRLNIRPFMTVPDVKKKGAGVLREKPNIHWKKDRGKDVESAPWYPLFKGDRINDHHLSLAEKRAGREKMEESV